MPFAANAQIRLLTTITLLHQIGLKVALRNYVMELQDNTRNIRNIICKGQPRCQRHSLPTNLWNFGKLKK